MALISPKVLAWKLPQIYFTGAIGAWKRVMIKKYTLPSNSAGDELTSFSSGNILPIIAK